LLPDDHGAYLIYKTNNEEARKNLQQWWAQMRAYWETNVKPLVPPSS
jgi:hypothetical protein